MSWHRYYGPFSPIDTDLERLIEIGIIPCTELEAVFPPPTNPDLPSGNDTTAQPLG